MVGSNGLSTFTTVTFILSHDVYDDWCFAQFAKALGKEDVYQQFLKRSRSYKNGYDTSVNLVRRRHADGTRVSDFNPYYFGTVGGWNGKEVMEGTAFQYNFFVPQDVQGIIQLMGKNTFVKRLEDGLKNNLPDPGNHPCLAEPFLFSYAGKPWLMQHCSRHIAKTLLDTSPYKGWASEEDEGQMSALYVLLSLGLFVMDRGCAVKPYYNLSTPVFDNVVIHLSNHFYSLKPSPFLPKKIRKIRLPTKRFTQWQAT